MKKSASAWHTELKHYKDKFTTFTAKGNAVVERYRDERKGANNTETRFNILWSNVSTLKPAVYSRPPKPEVSRRFKDKNPIARTAATILERALEYEITQFDDYNSALSNAVEDRLLPGRGVAWVRYEPTTEEITEDATPGDNKNYGDNEHAYTAQTKESNALAGQEPLERIIGETTPVDYVYWQDFAHLPARTWDEVTWVARRVYLSLNEGIERFGDDFRLIPLTNKSSENDEEDKNALKKAEIWEIWCKSTKTVHWIAANYEFMLDERDDPLGLPDFFPCPKPIYATTTTSALCPIADYLLYQDQARELDEITSRIYHLTKAMQIKGVYAANEQALERLLKEGQDGDMIPIINWAAFAEKGGLKGAFEMLSLGEISNTLAQLYIARDSAKQIIYEITGISDIIRGASNAAETATAQQIKSQFAGIRLSTMKDDVARFAVELLRMKAAIMSSKYQPQTLIDASGIMNTPDAQYAEQAIQLLRNEPLRNFNIDIETDTLVEIDEKADKESRIEFLAAAGGFLEKAVAAGQQAPAMIPLLGEMLMFGIRGFKVGATIEGTFEAAQEQMQQQQAQLANQPPSPDPEQLKLQAEQEAESMKAQLEAETAKLDIQAKTAMEAARIDLEKWQTELTEKTKLLIAQINAETTEKTSQITSDTNLKTTKLGISKKMGIDPEIDEINDDGEITPSLAVGQLIQTVQESANAQTEALNQLLQMMSMQNQAIAMLGESLSRPKQVIRDENGRISGVL